MFRFVVLFAAFAAVTARASIPAFEIGNALNSNLIDFGGDREESPLTNGQSIGVPNVFLLAHLTAVPSVDNVEGTMRYTLGKRVQNDKMVGYTSDTKTWEKPQNVTLNLWYPVAGKGATVTCVEIIVGQSSKLGDAKVTSGGIGQHAIQIAVTARNTSWVNYVVYFYGI